jgi:hypothetical protein
MHLANGIKIENISDKKISRSMEIKRFKIPNEPYSNSCSALEKNSK